MKKLKLNLENLNLNKNTVVNLEGLSGGQLPKTINRAALGSCDDCNTEGSRFCYMAWVQCAPGLPKFDFKQFENVEFVYRDKLDQINFEDKIDLENFDFV